MRHLRLLRHRLRSLFRRRAVDDELESELSLHLEQLTRELIDAGASENDARRTARLRFGPPDSVREQCRDTRRIGVLEDLVRDLAYATRVLVRSPGFALTAVLSLALGLGANIAIFSVVDAVLLRSLPVRHPEELVFIEATGTEGANGAPPYPCFERFRHEASAFAAMSAFAADDLKIQIDGHVEQVFGQVVSGNYFETLGIRPAAGRLLSHADERLVPPVAVIGFGYWQRRFGGAPDIVGKTLSFRNQPYTIVGVTPPEFWGLQPGRQVDLSLPITLERDQLTDAGSWWFEAVARLRPGVSVALAATQADTIYQRFSKDDGRGDAGAAASRLRLPTKYFDHIELQPASHGLDRLRSRFSTPLHMLTLVAAIVLVIACANLGNLLLVRGAVRQREFAIRLAAGAGTGRLVRQLLTETLLLFALGSAAGIALAGFSLQAWRTFFAVGRNPIVLDVRVDWRMAAFAAAIALATGILTALWPAWHAIKADPHAAMKSGDLRLAARGPLGRMRRVLVSGQVALSLVLLVAAVLFVRTLVNLRAVDPGFAPRGVLTMSINPVLEPNAPAAERPVFWHRTLDRIRSLPGVRAASLSVLSPLSGRDTGHGVSIPGYRPRQDEDLMVHVNHVSEDYFRAYGIVLVAGRDFNTHDTAGTPKVAIINEAAALAYFAGRAPIGQTLRFGPESEYEVVAVARDAKHLSLREVTPRFVYLPIWQPLEGLGRMTLAVASDEPTARLARAVAQEVLAVRSNTLVSDVITVQDQIDATLVSERLLSILGAGFAALALGLAAVGLYGILSYVVTRRRAELGIRMALGAVPLQVAWTVFREVLLEVGLGLTIGLLLALAVGRAAQSLLFGVRAGDPASYLVSVGMLAVVACLASSAPTLRACSIDPSEALRRE